MSSYGELIQALGVLKNVKEKRHGIKTLSSLCANRQFQVRIVQRGGWKSAILPLIISLDEECRKYAALAIANLSYTPATHRDLLDEDVLKHLVPILYSEECPEVVIYVLNALGNFASSDFMWQEMQDMKAVDAVVNVLRHTQRETTKLNCLFCLANMTEDNYMRAWMMENAVYELVWGLLQHLSYTMREYALATLRGLSAERSAQEKFPQMGILPILIGIFQTNQPLNLRMLALDIMHHISFVHANAADLMHPNTVGIIHEVSRDAQYPELVSTSISTIANLCESVDLHDKILDSQLFEVLNEHILDENIHVRQHICRAFMHLALSPRYHHIILETGVVANACPIAMMDRMPAEVRANALQMMGAVCATHPSTPTENDIVDVLHLICSAQEHMEIRRAAALVIANASSDSSNKEKMLQRPFMEVLVLTISKLTDVVLTDYLMQYFHNICKMDPKAGAMLTQAGYHKHMFTYDRLESLSPVSVIYLCDTCREVAGDNVVRTFLMEEQIIVTMMDAWVQYMQDPKITPHLALMCSAFAFYADCHQEFVLQGGVRLVKQLYQDSKVEHVRLCCVVTLLYLAESDHAQRSIAQERGMQMLLHACENETHIDLITNSMKALIPFASSDDFRPQLGMDGGLDTFASFLFSEELSLQQLGVYLLQNLLELRANRRIFLGLSKEKQCCEDYLEPLVKFLPVVTHGPPKRLDRGSRKGRSKSPAKKAGKDLEVNVSPHDPFIVRSAIHCLALLSLEHHEDVHKRFIKLQLPASLYNLFYSGHIDRSSGEAVVLFFANALHGSPEAAKAIQKGIDAIAILLCCHEMQFEPHTNVRCLSALLNVSRQPDFKRAILGHIELIMVSVNANLNVEDRDEDFYAAAALHCSLLCELTRAPAELHEYLAKVGVIEAFLVFITVAGRGLRDEICIELLMGAVYGISMLMASPTCGMKFMKSMLFPASRLQLFMSLLRLPPDDINSTFHMGTFGIRALQRNIFPGIQPNELHIDHLEQPYFLELCQIKPSDFIYRYVVRTLCLLLADGETRRRVMDAISTRNIVPTCLFALRGSKDIFTQVFGYLMVAGFSCEASLVPSFVGDAAIMNEILSCCRRAAQMAAGTEGDEDPIADQLNQLAKKGGTMWSPTQVAMKRMLLSMISLTCTAESIKEKYRIGAYSDAPEDKLPDDKDDGSGLHLSNKVFMRRFAGLCLKDIDTKELGSSARITETQEFAALLRLICVHNSTLTRIDLEARQKGGLVAYLDEAEERRRRPTPAERILPDLRTEFRRIREVQEKTDGLLELVDTFIEMNASRNLVLAIMELLSGMTYLSPLSISSPFRVFQLLQRCPEWLQPNLCLLLANTLADGILADPEAPEWRDKDMMLDSSSQHLFPLLSTCSLETRNYTLAFLANLSTQLDFFDFVKTSRVFEILRPLPSRGYFAQHFQILVEAVRMLANLSARKDAHVVICTENAVGFLRDTLRHVAALLHSGITVAEKDKVKPVYTRIDVEFDEDVMPPLGMRIRWEQPAQIIEILDSTPASRLTEGLQEGDELMEVNGVDVSEMEHMDIAPMLETRPLHLLFRRRVEPDRTMKKEDRELELNMQIEEITDTQFYGSREEFVECFHLGLVALHNFATTPETHGQLLAEPKILNLLIELIGSEVLAPSMRRLIFSTLTCFAQRKDIAGRIFYQMSDYFMSCEHADSSLQKYIMLCANLFYTSMNADEVKPDRSMLIFVGKMSDMQGQEEAAMALVEILHGMARAPREVRGPFISRETLVLTTQFMETAMYWDVQIRAFESAYFLTLGTCDPELWAVSDIVPRMVKAAGEANRVAQRVGEGMDRVDALFELTIRVIDMCLEFENLVKYFQNLPDLDRYLLDMLGSTEKPPYMAQVSAHLMAGLLRSEVGGTSWARWKTLGMVEKILVWFRSYKSMLDGKDTKRASRCHDTERGGGGRDLDQMMNMLLFAIEHDEAFVTSLVGEDIMGTIAHRILSNVALYKRCAGDDYDPGDHAMAEDLARANVSYRTIAQLLATFSSSADGVRALCKMDLELPLVTLLQLPPADYRMPTLLMLCTMAVDKLTCGKLMRDETFKAVLTKFEHELMQPEASLSDDELEYVTCIVDRCLAYPDLVTLMPSRVLKLFAVILSKAKTADCQLMVLRGVAQIALQAPQCMEHLPESGLTVLHFCLALCNCLRTEGDRGGAKSAAKQAMRSAMMQMQLAAPAKARQAGHFARCIISEAVSVSRTCARAVFDDFDGLGMLDGCARAFEDAYERVSEKGGEKQDLVAAELLAQLTCMCQVFLNSVFRQGRAHADDDALFEGEGKTTKKAKDTVAIIVRVLDSVHGFLQLDKEDTSTRRQSQAERARDDPKFNMARVLCEDIRTLYFVTALLHELCAKDLRSAYLAAVRTGSFYRLLKGCVRIALKRFGQVVRGPPPRDLFAGRQGYGQFESPMVDFLDSFSLAHVFEHLLVCLRHLLLQAMYVETPEIDDRSEPWVWHAQDKLAVHQELFTWLPEVLKRYAPTNPALTLETLRYMACATTFYEAPEAPSWVRGKLILPLPKVERIVVEEEEEKADRPGLYVVKKQDLPVTREAGSVSRDTVTSELNEGQKVHILEVVELPDLGLTRGQVHDPVGWITLLDQSSGQRSAEREAQPDEIAAKKAAREKALAEAAAKEAEVPQLRKFAKFISPNNEEVREILVDALEHAEDPCLKCLAVATVSNLAEYERQQALATETPQSKMQDQGLRLLVPSMVKAMKGAYDCPREIGISIMANGIRFLITCLAFNSPRLAIEVYGGEAWEAAGLVLHQFFRDEFKVEDVKEYEEILRPFLVLTRNWICTACILEKQYEGLISSRKPLDTRHLKTDEDVQDAMNQKEEKEARENKDLKILSKSLEATSLLNFLVAVTMKLTKTERKIENLDEMKDVVYLDVLMGFQTLFKRQEDHGKLDWKPLKADTFDSLLEEMHIFRRERSGKLDDETIINTLYMMTKLAYPYSRSHFPDYLMEVAYGPREEHSILCDIGAICCAIIFTQNTSGDGKAPTCNLSSVVKDYKDFVHTMSMVPDPRLQLWHFRTITMWSTKPKVIDDVARHGPSLQFIAGAMLKQYLDRYGVVFVHNISCLRAHRIVKASGTLRTLCLAYKRFAFGKEEQRGDNAQRRMLRRMILATIRNCTYLSDDLNTDLSDEDLRAIAELVEDLEFRDVPIYLAALRNICDNVKHERVAAVLPRHGPLVALCAKQLCEQAKNTNPGYSEPEFDETDLYDLFTGEADVSDEEEVEDLGAPDSPKKEPKSPSSPTRRSSTRRKTIGKDQAPPVKGLGKRVGLYKKARMSRAAAAAASAAADDARAAGQPVPKVVSRAEQASASERHTAEIEYVYCSVIEIMTHTTFKEDNEEARAAIDAAFESTFSIGAWLTTLAAQGKKVLANKQTLEDVYVHNSAKLIWHGWSNPMFRPHFDMQSRTDSLAELVPFFLEWPNTDVHALMSDVCLAARLHRYTSVCDYLVKSYGKYPELAATILSGALVDPEAILKPYQAARFVKVFVDLLRMRALSRGALRRVVLGLATAMLNDHPTGFAAYLLQSEYELLGDLIEQLIGYSETGYVKQCTTVVLAQTLGLNYKALPQLDNFVLRVLDMAPMLLEGEFELFLPILHRICFYGGKRIQHPVIIRQLHMRVARIMEAQVNIMEEQRRKALQVAAGYVEAGDEVEVATTAYHLDPQMKAQWCLAVFTVLAANEINPEEEEEPAHGRDHDPNTHFDSFVCVDLLPLLVRILKLKPTNFQAAACLFLMSSVCDSPCIAPHMPDVLRLAERAFLPRIEHSAAEPDPADEEAGKDWVPLRLPAPSRVAIGMRRTFVHLLGRAGFLPQNNPALLKSAICFKFLRRQNMDEQLFEDPVAPLHVKLLALAHMCGRVEDHKELLGFNVLEVLYEAEQQISEEATKQPRDLRNIWLRAVLSLAKLSGPRMLTIPKACRLFEDSFEVAESLLSDNLKLKTASGLALGMECQQALAAIMCPLSLQKAFEPPLRAKYTAYLLCLICSGQLPTLRTAACEYLIEMVGQGYNPEVCGSVLMSTTCVEGLRQVIGGPDEAFAVSCCRVMIAFVECGGFACHLHLLANLSAVLAMLGDAGATQLRILWLAELFVAMTKKPCAPVIDALIEQTGIPAFLSLAKSNQNSRRELVGRWLEGYGSSLYEIDEVSEVFQLDSIRGLLFLGSRCSLEPSAAQDMRRIMFALIYRRVMEWRKSVFGVTEYLKEHLMNAMVPCCELQPDLVVALVAMWHELLSEGEHGVLDRVWTGGHFPWLCRRMQHKSGAQLSAHRSSGLAVAPLGAPWDRHADLVCAQGMSLLLLRHMYGEHPTELPEKAVKRECVTKSWKEYVTYYFRLPWPMKDTKEVEASTEAAILLCMQLALRIAKDVNEDNLRKLVQQGMLGVTFAVLLANPQDQEKYLKDLNERKAPSEEQADVMDPEDALLPEAKMMAGAITARLLTVPDGYNWVAATRVASTCVAMYAQLYHWKALLHVHQSAYPVLNTMTLMERQATLYLSMLWVLSLEWGFEYLGIGNMATICSLCVDFWARHPNKMMRHYSLRSISMWFQVEPIYSFVMADPPQADLVSKAVDQTFSAWDVRALRHMLRILCAALAFALKIPVMPKSAEITISRAVERPGAKYLSELMKDGAALRASYAAEKYLLRPKFLADIITWVEHPNGDTDKPGDIYGRVWALWLVMTMLVHKENPEKKDESAPGTGGVLVFGREVNMVHLERRRQLAEAKVAVGVGNLDDIKRAVEGQEANPTCRIDWLVQSQQLCQVLSIIAGTCIKYHWKESLLMGNTAAARFLMDLPHFLHTAVWTIDGGAALHCLGMPEKPINLCALSLIAVASSFHLPLRAQTIGEEFLKQFHTLQGQVIEGISRLGEGPYDLLARWLHLPVDSLPCPTEFRCLITFIIGQCVTPPLAEAPSLKRTGDDAGTEGSAAPPVAVCSPPPKALVDAIAVDIRKEDQRLRREQVQEGEYAVGPLFSTMLCHSLYALAVMVPLHAQATAGSAVVRGSCFAQLMKVQQIIAQKVPSHFLLDKQDGKQAKLFLYLRAVASVRSALQCIASSWLSADIGSEINISDEGGRDFVQYCAKHINQAYNSKTALTRVLGSPWERVMLGEGPTSTIAELLLKVCNSDDNLREVSRYGASQALHSLSRFGESAQVRQQATMLLTKLAVMSG